MKDALVPSTYKEFTHVRTHCGQVYHRDSKCFPKVEIFKRKYVSKSNIDASKMNNRPDEEDFIRIYDKSGEIHAEAMACTAHLLGIQFLTKRTVLSGSFTAEVMPYKTRQVDNHGCEYEVVTQWGIPIPEGVISNPEGMSVTVEYTEVA